MKRPVSKYYRPIPYANYDEWAAIGEEMYNARQDIGITRTELARHLGISSQFLRDMEYGRRFYSDKYFDKAVKYLL